MHWSKIVSGWFGVFANYRFPRFLQRLINQSYVGIFGIDLSVFDSPESYPSLNALFTRVYSSPPSVSPDVTNLVSPCDGCVISSGEVGGDKRFGIKGTFYELKDFGIHFEGMTPMQYLNIYLSPKDYHRFHAPCDLFIEEMYHFPGCLYPVNQFFLSMIGEVYAKNERIVLRGKDSLGNAVYVVFVGALNVGSIRLHLMQKQEFKQADLQRRQALFTAFKKGDEIGYFEMGSTILLFAEKYHFHVQEEQKLFFLQPVGIRTH